MLKLQYRSKPRSDISQLATWEQHFGWSFIQDTQNESYMLINGAKSAYATTHIVSLAPTSSKYFSSLKRPGFLIEYDLEAYFICLINYIPCSKYSHFFTY